ncbi:MAG TPA: protein BatD [Flavobacteriales bacterium]|nr:protein BatD [Flavobacteriales bacterium]
MRATVSKLNVQVGERFKLEFKFDGNVKKFSPPDLSQFKVVSGPNQSSMSQYVNGNFAQSMVYSYILAAKKKGKLKISGARINAHGKAHPYDDIVMNVSVGNAKNKVANQSVDAKPKGGNNDLFIKASVNKRNVYVGEGISVTYTVYFKVDIVGNEVSQLPAFKGFWTQDVEMPKQVKVYSATVNGVRYQAADLKKTILFPQRSGDLELDPMHFKAVVRTRASGQSRSIFDNFFGGYKDVEYIVKSKPIKIVVKPLPEKGKPRNFKGDVGKYKLVSSVDKTELTANDAASLVIKISGSGNLKLIDALELNLPPDVETYDPKITDRVSVKMSGVTGSRTYEHLLVPRHAGQYIIEPVEFSYFNQLMMNCSQASSYIQ